MFYLFPIICECKKDFEFLYHPRMKGVFIGDTNKPEWEDKIVVLFKTCAPKEFKDFYRNNKYCYKNYYEEIDDNYYEILSFQIPPKFKKDLASILNNNFEEVSGAFKNQIDWISYPENSNDYWTGKKNLHKRILKIEKSKIQLDLNKVNNKGYTKQYTLCVFIFHKTTRASEIFL